MLKKMIIIFVLFCTSSFSFMDSKDIINNILLIILVYYLGQALADVYLAYIEIQSLEYFTKEEIKTFYKLYYANPNADLYLIVREVVKHRKK